MSPASTPAHRRTTSCSGRSPRLVRRSVAAIRAGLAPAPALAARLEKRIPVAAGLAGGSSDAAAALDGALEAWGAELDEATHHAVAARLGSDVPFFLAGGPALVEGRGETVAPLHGLHGAPGVLLVTPVIAVPTPDVFAAFDAIRHQGDGAVRLSSAHLAEELRAGLCCRGSRRARGRPRVGERSAPGDSPRRPGSRPVQASAQPHPRTSDRAVRLRADPLGALSFRGGGDRPPPTPCEPPCARALSPRRARPNRSSPPRPSWATQRKGIRHDPSRRLDGRSARRHRPVQPGDRQRRPPVLLRAGRPGPGDPATLVEGGIEPETERVMANLTAVLDAGGATWEDVVKTTIFLVDMADFATVNAIYGRFVGDPPPARSTVGVAALPKGARVEIEVVRAGRAARRGSRRSVVRRVRSHAATERTSS